MVVVAYVDGDLFVVEVFGLGIKYDHTVDSWLHELTEYVNILNFGLLQVA